MEIFSAVGRNEITKWTITHQEEKEALCMNLVVSQCLELGKNEKHLQETKKLQLKRSRRRLQRDCPRSKMEKRKYLHCML